MSIQQLLLAGGNVASFAAAGIHFISASKTSRSGTLTGATSGLYGSVSFWLKCAGGINGGSADDGNNQIAKFANIAPTTPQWNANFDDSDAFTQNHYLSTSGHPSFNAWHWIAASWQLGGTNACWIDGVDRSSTAPFNDGGNMDWNNFTNWTINDFAASTFDLAEFWFTAGSSSSHKLDFSSSTVRDKFAVSKKPANLGSDGSTPLGGTAPLLYFHVDGTESISNFATNRSGRGDFTPSGTLAYASTSPEYA